MVVLLDDIIIYDHLVVNGMISNHTELNINVETYECVITKNIKYCASNDFGDRIPGKLEFSLPIKLTENEMAIMGDLFTTLADGSEYVYRIGGLSDGKQYVKVQIGEEEKYLVEADDIVLRKLSKLYMPEVLRYFNINKLKYIK